MRVPSFGDQFCLTLLTNDPDLAGLADRAGVNRIGVDFERLGKARRQAGQDTRLSDHTWDDLARISRAIVHAERFVRLDPMNPNSSDQIERVLQHGAQVLMLPFFQTPEEVDGFVQLVGGRARVIILLETSAAAVRIQDIVSVPGVDEVMFGLNDLRLQLGVESHFEVLASPILDGLATAVRDAGLPLSIGGVARADDSSLPVSPDLVYAQFPRLGATGAWLGRSFIQGGSSEHDFANAVTALRRRLTAWSVASPAALERARSDLARQARTMPRK
jgi:hypothetical protein